MPKKKEKTILKLVDAPVEDTVAAPTKTEAFKKSHVLAREATHAGQKPIPAPAKPMTAEARAEKTAAFKKSHVLAREAAHAGRKVRNA